MTIYEIGYNSYWTGQISTVNNSQGAPAGWTRMPIPTLIEGEYAFWVGEWEITSMAPTNTTLVVTDNSQESLVARAARLIQTQRILAQIATRGQTV